MMHFKYCARLHLLKVYQLHPFNLSAAILLYHFSKLCNSESMPTWVTKLVTTAASGKRQSKKLH